MDSGILLLDKSEGITSRKEVDKIIKKLNLDKAGHIGTLDPFATGLLIVLVNKGTKISPFLENMDKTYLASLKLGIRTDTLDKDGNIIERREVEHIDIKEIKEIFSSLEGQIEQTPPMYSAIKINGKPLYKYAREGKEIVRNSRLVNIKSLKLLSLDKDEITFVAEVSKGTYIRSLGEEIASRLNTVGHLTSLRRLKVGPFDILNAKKVDEISKDDLISIEDALKFMPSFKIEKINNKKFINGVPQKIDSRENKILILDEDGPIAIYQKERDDFYICLRGLR